MEEYWDEERTLIDYLFSTNLSRREIANKMGVTEYKVSQQIKALGLDWVKRKNHKLSRGHSALLSQMQKLLPGEEIVTEYHVGERLMLDIYCPKYMLGAEFHGRQHFEYVEHYHKNMAGFLASQDRDQRKEELCREQGIALVVFRYNDEMNEDTVYARMLDALRSSSPVTPKPQTTVVRFKGNPYYESAKKRRREYRREQYKKIKQEQDKKKRK